MPFGFCVVAALASTMVSGNARCPTPEQVSERLDKLAFARESAGERVQVDEADGGVKLSLRDASGAELAQKKLSGAADCEQLADAAAVVVAAWLSDFANVELAPPPQKAAASPPEAAPST